MVDQPTQDDSVFSLAGKIAAAFVSNNPIPASEVPNLLRSIYSTLNEIKSNTASIMAQNSPAVPVAKSITPEYLICLEDGKRLKMLKRYLRTKYEMTVEDYRKRWNLPSDYPMVAPNYSKKRSSLAKANGLGHTPQKKRGRRATR